MLLMVVLPVLLVLLVLLALLVLLVLLVMAPSTRWRALIAWACEYAAESSWW